MPTTTNLTYLPRECTFHQADKLLDEKIISHDHRILNHYQTRRQNVSHRELGNLHLLANLTRIQWGYWGNEPACLIGWKFQFQGSEKHWRFEKADIRLSFTSSDHDSPIVVDYGPKHLVSAPTEESRKWWYNATLSAHAPLGPVDISPSLSAGNEGTYTNHTAASIAGADFTDHGHTEPNIVKFWLREDSRQQNGLLLSFDCATILRTSTPFNATVDVKIGPVFDWLATPWPRDSPVTFSPGVDYDDPIRAAPILDFATLTLEEWRKLVTPDLTFREEIHSGVTR